MVSVNQRGWTWLDEDKAPDPDSPEYQAVSARADALMAEWSQIHHDQEQEAFNRQRGRDGDYGYEEYDPRCCECDEGRDIDPDELCVHDRRQLQVVEHSERVREEGVRLRVELIETELNGLGIRKMRAYEHHNEDEAYYQYMEEGRFGHYSD